MTPALREQFLRFCFEKTEHALKHHLNTIPEACGLADAMRYATLGSGKRVRPALVFASAELLKIPDQIATDIACSIELAHCFSLIHDDLPAMDDDDVRRDKPSCHKAYGEALAVLAGDALHALAFSCLSNSSSLRNAQKVKLLSLLSQTTGGAGMCGGQALDIHYSGHPADSETLTHIHYLKTGALFAACVRMPLACSSQAAQSLVQALENYGKNIGLCFQSRDDWLDFGQDQAKSGAATTKNKTESGLEKSDMPNLPGMERACKEIFKLEKECLSQLSGLGEDAGTLRMLTKYIARRKS